MLNVDTINISICKYDETRFQLTLKKRSGYIRAGLMQFHLSTPSGSLLCVCLYIYPHPLGA